MNEDGSMGWWEEGTVLHIQADRPFADAEIAARNPEEPNVIGEMVYADAVLMHWFDDAENPTCWMPLTCDLYYPNTGKAEPGAWELCDYFPSNRTRKKRRGRPASTETEGSSSSSSSSRAGQ